MHSSNLNNRVALYKRNKTQSEFGAIEEELELIGFRYCQVIDETTRNQAYNTTAGQTFYHSRLIITLRYDTSLLKTDEIKYSGVSYKVTYMRRDVKNKSITFDCQKILPIVDML